MRALLKVLSGPHVGAELPLNDGRYRLGKAEHCEIVFSDTSLADEHVEIVVETGEARVKPLGGAVTSREGTLEDESSPVSLLQPYKLGASLVVFGREGETWPDEQSLIARYQADLSDAALRPDSAVEASAPQARRLRFTSPTLAMVTVAILSGAALLASTQTGATVLATGESVLRDVFASRELSNVDQQQVSPPPAPRDLIEAVFQSAEASGTLESYQVGNSGERLAVVAYVTTNRAASSLEDDLRRLAPAIKVDVYASERMIDSVADGLAEFGLDLSVEATAPGVLSLSGFTESLRALEQARDTIKKDVPGILSISTENVVLAPEALKLMHTALAAAGISTDVALSLAGRTISATGALSELQRDSWRQILSQWRQDYGQWLTFEPRLELVEASAGQPVVSDVAPIEAPGPQIAVRAIGRTPIPYVVTSGGERFELGSNVGAGWLLTKIDGVVVELTRDGRRFEIQL